MLRADWCHCAFVSALYVAAAVMHGEGPELTILKIMPGLDLTFAVTPPGAVFGCVASGLWILASLYTTGYMRGNNEKHQTRFAICYAVAVHAALAIAYSGNLMVLFIFYEILTFSTYPLVTHKETKEAVAAGRLYMGILVGTSVVLLLPAMIWVWVLTGSLDFTPGGLLGDTLSPQYAPWMLALFAFGIGKAALMPIHRWLPAAMVAPTPVSALLHAVAVVKAGVFTMLMVVVYIFGIDFLQNRRFRMACLAGAYTFWRLRSWRSPRTISRRGWPIRRLASFLYRPCRRAGDVACGGGRASAYRHACNSQDHAVLLCRGDLCRCPSQKSLN